MRRSSFYVLLSAALVFAPPPATAAVTPQQADAIERLSEHPKIGPNALAELRAASLAGRDADVDITFSVHSPLTPFYRPGLDDDPASLNAIREDILVQAQLKRDDLTFDAADIGLISLSIDALQALRLARHPNVRSLGVLPAMRGFTAQSATLADFPHVWNAGFDGDGVKVAVIDNGFSPHPAIPIPFREACFCGDGKNKACCANFQSVVVGSGASDYIGPPTGACLNEACSVHGTSVLATLNQEAVASTFHEPGLSRGISAVAINIGGATGAYNASGMVNALNWLRTAPTNDVSVVVMSFGNFDFFDTNASCALLDYAGASLLLADLHLQGVTLIAAAGNEGSTHNTWPACLPQVISVGAAWNQTGGFFDCSAVGVIDNNAPAGQMTCYTSRSSYLDLAAAGSHVTLARSQRNAGVWSHDAVERNGTSFAAPVVAGCAAALLQANPAATPEMLRTALRTSPTDAVHPSTGYSRPLLNCAHALANSTAPKIPLANAGLSGAWYEPRTSGQGFYLNVYAGIGGLWAGWFTYDTTDTSAQGRRWYTLQNGVAFNAQDTEVTLTILQATGGNFNAPPPISNGGAQVGTATLSFTSCTAGRLQFQFNDGRTGTIPLTRLDSAFCNEAAGGLAGDINYTGLWHRNDLPGQGMMLRLIPDEQRLIGAWFTYDVNGSGSGEAGQEWYTIDNGTPGEGQPPGSPFDPQSKSAGINLIATVGGLFNTPAAVSPTSSTPPVGSGSIQFTGCDTATLNYSFSDGRTGTIFLTRVGPAPGPC